VASVTFAHRLHLSEKTTFSCREIPARMPKPSGGFCTLHQGVHVRRTLLAMSAAATLLLGLEKVGVYQFVPGGNTGFHFAPLDGRPGYSLVHANSGGDLSTWVRLIVRHPGSGVVQFAPLEWSGDPLAVRSRPLADGSFEVTISKDPSPPVGVPFVWRAGVPLEILQVAPTDSLSSIDYWALYPSSQAPDDLGLATKRRQWTVVSWVLLPLALIGAIVSVLKERDSHEAVTTRTLARAIIDDIAGRDAKETKKLRLFMRKVVLEEVPVGQALVLVGFVSGAWTQRRAGYAFQARATKLFRDRVDIVLAEFDRYNRRLTSISE